MSRTAVETVSEFRKRMHFWELSCKNRVDACIRDDGNFESVKAEGMNEYMNIFHEYCTSNATPRSFCYCEPPEYELSAKVICQKSENGESIVSVECILFPYQRSDFTLVHEGGHWRILERVIVTDRGEWLSADL